MDRRDLDGVWTVLSSTIPALGIEAAPTGHEVAAGQLLAGIDSEGRRHLLIPLSPGEPARTDTSGRAVQLGRVTYGAANYLTVFCLRPELHRVFTQFCRELADSVEGVPSPAREAAEAFTRWRALFSESSDLVLLGDEALVGLLGEMLTVAELLKLGAPANLDYWVGPFGHVHDFRTPTHAIEVKSTTTREGRVVTISGVDQLQEPPGADLVLRHTRFERDPGGASVLDVVSQVISVGADRAALAGRLLDVGIDINDLTPYAGRRWRIVETRCYDVAGATFPRLIRSSFASGDVPAGTLNLSYGIDLTNEPPVPLDETSAGRVLQAMAREAADAMDT